MPDNGIDILVIDGPPMPIGPKARYPVGPVLFPRLNKDATVFLNDADRDDEREIVRRWTKDSSNFELTNHTREKGCVSLYFSGDD